MKVVSIGDVLLAPISQ